MYTRLPLLIGGIGTFIIAIWWNLLLLAHNKYTVNASNNEYDNNNNNNSHLHRTL